MSISQFQFLHSPREAVSGLLKNLPSRRMRDVVEKRFGLKTAKKRTLDAIGREYKITRERVRQIEAEALRHLQKPVHAAVLAPAADDVRQFLETCGGVASEEYIARAVGSAAETAHALFLLSIVPEFHFAPETDELHSRWAVSEEACVAADKSVAALHERLEALRVVPSEKELGEILESVMGDALVRRSPARSAGGLNEGGAEAFLALSKLVRKNPYGEYGLSTTPDINPRGVRDKAYIAMARHGNPMHFRDVADAINRAAWSKKRAHPQTVHNELIKDSRFVLVGRGLYALSEWGYEPGIVRDVVATVIKEAGRPLTKDEVIERVAAKRKVKTPTILLNLQNRSFFARTEDDKFTVA